MQTVVPTGTFEKKAESMLGLSRYEAFVADVARNPLNGVLIEGTGGLRKVRVAREGRGKSGGARVIYYYHNENMPIFLVAIYAKSEQGNLSDSEKNVLKKLVEELREY